MTCGSPRILMVDAMIGNDYAIRLCSALKQAGTDIRLIATQGREVPGDLAFPVNAWAPAKGPSTTRARKAIAYIEYLWRLTRYIRTERIDIAHFQFFRRERIESFYFLLLRLTRVKLIYTFHNVLPHESIRLDVMLKWIICRAAHRIVAHSEYMKCALVTRFHLHPDKVSVIPCGRSGPPAPATTRSEARAKLNLPLNGHVVLFFGFIRKYKGLELLLDAFAATAPVDPDLHLIIAGQAQSPELAAGYRQRLAEIGYGNRVLCDMTFVSDETTALYFVACDVVVLPYKNIYHSGVIHVAYAFGRPVIATRVGDFEESVIDGETGCLLPRNDAASLTDTLNRAFADRPGLERMGAAARVLSDTVYAWDSIAVKTRQLYRETLHAAAPTGSVVQP